MRWSDPAPEVAAPAAAVVDDPRCAMSAGERGTTANRRSAAPGYGRRTMPTTVARRPSTSVVEGILAPGSAADHDPLRADPELGPPAVTELVHVGDRSRDPHEPPLDGDRRRAGQGPRDGQGRRPEVGHGARPDPRRVIRPSDLSDDSQATARRWRAAAGRQEDLDAGCRVLDHDPPVRGIEQARRRCHHPDDGDRAALEGKRPGDRHARRVRSARSSSWASGSATAWDLPSWTMSARSRTHSR